LKSAKKWKVGFVLIVWERKVISLKYLKLSKSRKQPKWLMHISGIDNKDCEILQNREPRRLEKVGTGKRRMES